MTDPAEAPHENLSPIDDLDRQLMRLLSSDSRRPFVELAEEVGLSAPSVHARIKKLEKRGVIRRYSALLDPDQLGYRIGALIAVQQLPGFQWEHLESGFSAMEAVEACYSVTGEDTYVLVVRVADPAALEALLRDINQVTGVARTRTMLILSTVFERRRV